MEYNDEQMLKISDYEIMARAYSDTLKKQGFMIVQIDNEETSALVDETLNDISKIKSSLFMLGGFLNTSQFYSLNERQLKKLCILFDRDSPAVSRTALRDKTKAFLSFLSTEASLIKSLIILAEKSNYEAEIKKIVDARLSLLSKILEV